MQTIDDVIAEGASTAPLPPLSRRPIIPYVDLQALNQPETLSEITNTVISTLAILAAQGPNAAKLLRSDAQGNLHAAAHVSFSTTVGAPANIGDHTVTVVDPSFAAGGFWFSFQQTAAHGGVIDGPFFAQPTSDPHTLFSDVAWDIAPQIGDFLYATPFVMVQGTGSVISLASSLVKIVPGGPGTTDANVMETNTIYGHRRMAVDDARSYDWQVNSGTVSGQIATATIGAWGAGFRSVLACIMWSMFSSVANANDTVEIWQDAAGTGTLLGILQVGVVPANGVNSNIIQGLRFKGNDNKPLVVRMTNPAATLNHTVSIFGYLEA